MAARWSPAGGVQGGTGLCLEEVDHQAEWPAPFPEAFGNSLAGMSFA
jgi:hypothetical protein